MENVVLRKRNNSQVFVFCSEFRNGQIVCMLICLCVSRIARQFAIEAQKSRGALPVRTLLHSCSDEIYEQITTSRRSVGPHRLEHIIQSSGVA